MCRSGLETLLFAGAWPLPVATPIAAARDTKPIFDPEADGCDEDDESGLEID